MKITVEVKNYIHHATFRSLCRAFCKSDEKGRRERAF